MKVAISVIRARRRTLAEMLGNHRYLPLAEVCSRLGVSEATARRDLRALARDKQITRTYGGALGTLDATLVPFADRRGLARRAKARIATRARGLISPRTTCFFDSGTTVFALAEALYREPIAGLCAVTNSLPVAEMLGRRTEMEVHLLGGRFLQRQSILLGDAAQRSARDWKFDLVFLGAEGVSARGVWASKPELTAFQRTLIAQAKKVVVCVHAAKLGRETGAFLTPWGDKFQLVTDASPTRRARHGLSF
jgi:DeoR/GlpR family transcriptional regulator of sugar metabolism